MASKNRIDLIVDGHRVYSRSTTREYAWALVAVSRFGGSTDVKLRITNCGNDRRALERIRDENAKRSPGQPAPVLYPIVERVVRAASADLGAIVTPAPVADDALGSTDGEERAEAKAGAAAEDAREWESDRESAYGGVVDCMGNVLSDADPGL